MDIRIIKDAGYSHERDPSRHKANQELVWDDDYNLIPVGAQFAPQDEFFDWIDRTWNPVNTATYTTIDDGNYCLTRRLKPGLVKVTIKE